MPRWWSANWKNRSLFALGHPTYAFKAVVRDLFAMDERFLAVLTETTPSQIKQFLGEPFEDARFYAHLRCCENQFQGTKQLGADLYAKRVLLQYGIIRALKPDRVLETGVANGVSSTYLLLAMERNGTGVLHSIDVGDGSFLPPGKRTGWMVPEWLRARWDLHLGDSSKLLSQVVSDLDPLDVFIHDSLHTYEHMKFEYEQAYPRLRSGGILVSDDALWNPAFPEFVRSMGAPLARVLRGVGFLQKPRDTRP